MMRLGGWVLCVAGLGGASCAGWDSNVAEPSSSQLLEVQDAYRLHRSRLHNSRYVTLIDYSRSILRTRLWVIDQTTGATVLRARVAHAFNSGLFYATRFSNENNSRKSCAGTFITQDAYQGRFGLALRIEGVDPDNDNARARAIVFHETRAPYTQGCFATAPSTNRRLISLIKDGALVYVAH